jgi:hypothetical protein
VAAKKYQTLSDLPKRHRDGAARAYENQAMREVDAWIIPNSSEEFDTDGFLDDARDTEDDFHNIVVSAVEAIDSKK